MQTIGAKKRISACVITGPFPTLCRMEESYSPMLCRTVGGTGTDSTGATVFRVRTIHNSAMRFLKEIVSTKQSASCWLYYRPKGAGARRFILGGELEGADTQNVLREGLLFFSRFWRILVSFVLRFCVEPRKGSRGRLLMSF